MRAHLIPIPSDGESTPPTGSTASCRLDGPASSWLLALTDDAAAPYAVEDARLVEGDVAWAALTEFDGPRDEAQVQADRRSGRERVEPAAMQVDGARGFVSLRAADGANVVIGFADREATLDAISRAIMSTPLLPGEDPALLGGPDRYTACRLRDDSVTTRLRSTAGVTA